MAIEPTPPTLSDDSRWSKSMTYGGYLAPQSMQAADFFSDRYALLAESRRFVLSRNTSGFSAKRRL